tara:strand:+ start:1827 stop:2135 length:309 start_codon:yes stop_codon:yes gene_type:complete
MDPLDNLMDDNIGIRYISRLAYVNDDNEIIRLGRPDFNAGESYGDAIRVGKKKLRSFTEFNRIFIIKRATTSVSEVEAVMNIEVTFNIKNEIKVEAIDVSDD